MQDEESFFTRVISDQFLMLIPYSKADDIVRKIDALNNEFVRLQSGKFQGAQIRVRTGVYFIDPGCVSASLAIDAANYARKQVEHHSPVSIRVYDETLRKKQQLENEIVNGIDAAMKEQRVQVYLQPKISLTTARLSERRHWSDG